MTFPSKALRYSPGTDLYDGFDLIEAHGPIWHVLYEVPNYRRSMSQVPENIISPLVRNCHWCPDPSSALIISSTLLIVLEDLLPSATSQGHTVHRYVVQRRCVPGPVIERSMLRLESNY